MSANHLKKIAIVGASGNVGAATLKHLLSINPNISITIVSRVGSKATFPSSSQITVKQGGYDDPSFLQSAFEGSQLAMFGLGMEGLGTQPALIDAAAKARVKWIIPTEFGGDGLNEEMFRAIPLLHSKTAARKQIEELSKTHQGLRWIGVATGPWTEMSLFMGAYGIDVANRTATFWSGSGSWNSSSSEQVGRGVARLISLPLSAPNPRASLEHYANNFAYVSSYLLDQKTLFESVKLATGTADGDWKIEHSSIEERLKIAEEKLAAGDVMGGVMGKMYSYYMGEGLGGNVESKAKEDREVLGLEEENLDEVVKRALASAGQS